MYTREKKREKALEFFVKMLVMLLKCVCANDAMIITSYMNKSLNVSVKQYNGTQQK